MRFEEIDWDRRESVEKYMAAKEVERKAMLAEHRKALKKLRPTVDCCPFCGKLPSIGPERPDLDGDAWGFVSCKNG